MNTRHLSLFIAVAKARTVTEVANRLMISQPAVSMQLKRLEEELDVTLFVPQGKRIVLTDAGRALLEDAERMIALEEQMLRTIAEFREGRRGHIIVGVSASAAIYILPRFIAEFMQGHPTIEVELRHYRESELEQSVKNGIVDMGISLLPPSDHIGLRISQFVKDRLKMITPPIASKAERLYVPADLPLELEPFLPADQTISQAETTEAVKRYVAAGLGSGIVLESSVRQEMQSGQLKEGDAVLPHPTRYSIITRPAEKLAKSLWLLLDHLVAKAKAETGDTTNGR